MNLRSIVQEDSTRVGRIFDLFVQALIILSLIDFSIETLPNLSEEKRGLLKAIETAIVIFFTAEYALRVITAEKKREFIFSFYGVIDLAAILPFYLSTGIDLRSVRIFRLFKLFRIFKVLRYSKALNRMKEAFISVKEELVLFILKR